MKGASQRNENLDVGLEEGFGEQPFGAPIPRALRLSEAERIAAARLDGASEGSLKEALATRIVAVAPQPARLGERLQDIGPRGETGAAQWRAFQAAPEPIFGWMNAVPPAHAIPCFEAAEEYDGAAQEAADMMPIPGLHSPRVDVGQPEASADEASLEHSLAAVSAASQTPDPEAAVISEADGVATAHETAVDSASIAAAGHSLMVASPAGEDRLIGPAPVAATGASGNSLLDALVIKEQLAADAAAAAEALQHLKRLLVDQLGPASLPGSMDKGLVIPVVEEASPPALLSVPPAPASSPAALVSFPSALASSPAELTSAVAASLLAPPANDVPPPVAAIHDDARSAAVRVPPSMRHVASALACLPPPLPKPADTQDRRPILPSDVPAEVLPKCMVDKPRSVAAARNVPPPLPAARAQVRAVAVAEPASARAAAAKSAPPARQARRREGQMGAAHSGLDVRGFAAGFALSGAIGVVLYYVMSSA